MALFHYLNTIFCYLLAYCFKGNMQSQWRMMYSAVCSSVTIEVVWLKYGTTAYVSQATPHA